MSDKGDKTPNANGIMATFTERELQMLGWAMQSLKSGPPEIDYEKLAAFAGMSNPRSAGNAWAKIKNKLMVSNPDGAAVPTPKKPAAKRGKKVVDDEDAEDDPATPKTPKTPRKRGPKNQQVNDESSPKKKGRPAKSKVTVDKEDLDDDEHIKAEEVEDSGDNRIPQPTVESDDDV